MKRLLILITAAMLLASCGSSEKTESSKPEYLNSVKRAVEIQTEVMRCFEEKDEAGLKKLFSENAAAENDLDSQIKDAFSAIDSKIVSYESPSASATGGSSITKFNAETYDIKTESGTEYTISFHGVMINYNDPKDEGIHYISVLNETQAESAGEDAPDQAVYIGSHESDVSVSTAGSAGPEE